MKAENSFTIFALASPLMLSSAGTGMGSMSRPNCLTWLPGWATFQSSPPITTFALSNPCVRSPTTALPIAIAAW